MRIPALSLVVFLASFLSASAEVITVLPAHKRIVALTFDACETDTPAFFDKGIVDFLVKKKLPCTIFVCGKFTERNRKEIADLVRHGFVEIEHHSKNHIQHMERLTDAELQAEIDDKFLYEITGKRARFFRFPAGNYDDRTLKLVEKRYKVVHWTFPSGDADRKISPQQLTDWILSRTMPGSILVFHINQRGYSTTAALPGIISGLLSKGFVFVKLEDVL